MTPNQKPIILETFRANDLSDPKVSDEFGYALNEGNRLFMRTDGGEWRLANPDTIDFDGDGVADSFTVDKHADYIYVHASDPDINLGTNTSVNVDHDFVYDGYILSDVKQKSIIERTDTRTSFHVREYQYSHQQWTETFDHDVNGDGVMDDITRVSTDRRGHPATSYMTYMIATQPAK